MTKNKLKKIRCPCCGWETATVQYKNDANCAGIWTVCKNKNCKKSFEIIIIDGEQIII